MCSPRRRIWAPLAGASCASAPAPAPVYETPAPEDTVAGLEKRVAALESDGRVIANLEERIAAMESDDEAPVLAAGHEPVEPSHEEESDPLGVAPTSRRRSLRGGTGPGDRAQADFRRRRAGDGAEAPRRGRRGRYLRAWCTCDLQGRQFGRGPEGPP